MRSLQRVFGSGALACLALTAMSCTCAARREGSMVGYSDFKDASVKVMVDATSDDLTVHLELIGDLSLITPTNNRVVVSAVDLSGTVERASTYDVVALGGTLRHGIGSARFRFPSRLKAAQVSNLVVEVDGATKTFPARPPRRE